jgi:hypothetical protein
MMAPSLGDAERFVRNLYLGILRREPEPDALRHWAGQVEQGLELNAVVEAFLNSDEFQNQRWRARLAYPPGHFYSPVVSPEDIAAGFRRRAQEPVPAGLPGIAISLDDQVALWRRMVPLLAEIPFPDDPAAGFRYHFRNDAYGYGDASVLYAMLRLFAPRRLIEVGSGFSSACSLDTIDRYLAGRVKVSFIEPYGDLLRRLLGPDAMPTVDLHESGVQDVPVELFGDLQRDDILFIDSTHVMKTGSDVCHELFEILPSLAPGVLIHFHDVFWPFEYGEEWVLQENRSWNEIYGLRAFLSYNHEFEIVFFNDYFRRWQHELIAATYPKFLNNTGGSLWLRKT